MTDNFPRHMTPVKTSVFATFRYVGNAANAPNAIIVDDVDGL